jgi:dTDP-4-dehydrorhamnose reductase
LEWLFTDLAELDITDKGAVETFFERERPDVVVNCAAWTDVDRAETEREAAFRINCDAVALLADAARQFDASLVHISTDFVFDGASQAPYSEMVTPAPLNIYGESKLAGEKAVLESGCRGAVIRTSWLYSPYGRNFVKSILGAASKNAEIKVVADQWGCPTAADGLASAIVQMIPSLLAADSPADIYHYCDAGVVSRADFAAEIIRQAGLSCKVVPVASSEYPMSAARPAYSALNTSKLTLTFGITPRPWQEALRELKINLR